MSATADAEIPLPTRYADKNPDSTPQADINRSTATNPQARGGYIPSRSRKDEGGLAAAASIEILSLQAF
jgi:hypothetical protein